VEHRGDRNPVKRIRLSTVLLLVVILVLGYALEVQQGKEARLRAALALYKRRSQGKIQSVLDLPIFLDWPDETSLEEVIERIKVSSSGTGLFPRGIPIYVDPVGLQQAGKTLSSRVNAPPPDEIVSLLPLREKLRVILEPLGLAFQVKDASIVITSREAVAEPFQDEGGDESR